MLSTTDFEDKNVTDSVNQRVLGSSPRGEAKLERSQVAFFFFIPS